MSSSINDLIAGYQRFLKKYFQSENETFYRLSTEGQSPKTMLLTCCDSRINTSIVFGCEPGDLFIGRNVANLVPAHDDFNNYPATIAGIEFAVKHLQVENIIIMGHSQCGGVSALLESTVSKDSYIHRWMQIAKPAVDIIHRDYDDLPTEEKLEKCAHLSIINSLSNLNTYSWIVERLLSGKLKLHGWYFEFINGQISYFDDKSDSFQPLLQT